MLEHPLALLLACRAAQVDYHSFEGILYCAPLLGWLLLLFLRGTVTAFIQGSTRLVATAGPPLEGWLHSALPGGRRQLRSLKERAARLWWRQAPDPRRTPVPAPYDPHL